MRRAVRLRGIGRRQHERLRLVLGAELAQPLDRSGQRELRAAEPLDEVATSADADRLQILELAVHGAVTARDALTADAVARDDALALEQELGKRAPFRHTGEEPIRQRPAALRRCDLGRPGAGKTPTL